MSPLIASIVAALAGGTAVTVFFTFAGKFGAPKLVADKLAGAPDPGLAIENDATKPTWERLLGMLGHYLELALKATLSADELTAACTFFASHPSGTAIVQWIETNLGKDFATNCEAQLPAAYRDLLSLLGNHIPSVLLSLLARLLPSTVTKAANEVADAKSAAAKLVMLTTAANAAGSTPVAIDPSTGKVPGPAVVG